MAPWRIALAALAALLALCLLGPALLGPALVRAQLLPKIARRVGRQVRVSSIWTRWGKLELQGLELDGDGTTPPLRVPRLRVEFDMLPLLAGRIHVREVQI